MAAKKKRVRRHRRHGMSVRDFLKLCTQYSREISRIIAARQILVLRPTQHPPFVALTPQQRKEWLRQSIKDKDETSQRWLTTEMRPGEFRICVCSLTHTAWKSYALDKSPRLAQALKAHLN